MTLHRHQEIDHKDGHKELHSQEEKVIYMGEIKDLKSTELISHSASIEVCKDSSLTKSEELDIKNHSDKQASDVVELEIRQFDTNSFDLIEPIKKNCLKADTEYASSSQTQETESDNILKLNHTEVLTDKLVSELIPALDSKTETNKDEPMITDNLDPGLFIFDDQNSHFIQVLKTFIDDKAQDPRCSALKPERWVKCSICKIILQSVDDLEDHSKVHFINKKFACSLCDKQCSTRKVLKRHMRVHTGERPYQCEFCHKKFGAASNLSEHRTLHTGRMAYTCQLCGNKFRLWSSLNKHSLKCVGTPVAVSDKCIASTSIEEMNEFILVEEPSTLNETIVMFPSANLE